MSKAQSAANRGRGDSTPDEGAGKPYGPADPKKSSGRGTLFTILFTVFLDLVGVGIIIPVLGTLFISDNTLFAASVGFQTRAFLLGVLIACYPLAQFFGAPLLGSLSDRYGRKKLLLISLLGTFIGYILFSVGIIYTSLALLFISRIIDGFTGGNISIALSAIADISDHKSRTKNFGLIGMVFGLGFILGPFIGGKLAHLSISPYLMHAAPFLFTAALTLVNIGLVIYRFPETLKETRDSRATLLMGLGNLKKAFVMKETRIMFIVVFLASFGFNFFTQFFQVFLIERFAFNEGNIGNMFAYMGLWIAITQGFVTRLLAKLTGPVRALSWSLIGLAVVLPLLLLAQKAWFLYLVMPLIALTWGITNPNSTSLVSALADEKSQGEILGINQSIQSLSQTFPPLIAGALVALSVNLPIIVASLCVAIAWLVFTLLFRLPEKARQRLEGSEILSEGKNH
jgi:DHA1 family tetracycline resistance protein-like MFS transporter